MHKITVPLLSIIILCLLGTSLSVSVHGATLKAGPGSQYKSVTEAINAAQPGDTIIINPGTYSENVAVSKPVTIKAAGPRTTITAANPSKDVFAVSAANVRIEGFTITGATSASAVYLAGATNCVVSSNDLSNNGYGVYCDHASHNTISGNAAAGEKGGPKALGDGIYMYYCNDNTVTNNNLSANHVFGISLYYSNGNTIANNSMLYNEQIGTRLGYSNNNTLTYNTYMGNSEGIVPVGATGNQIYLNNFVNQGNPITATGQQTLNSPEQLSYTFSGATQKSYMGNYYSDYAGSDSGTGIGSTAAATGDKYPLVKPFQKYSDIGTATPTPSPSAASVPAASEHPSNPTNAISTTNPTSAAQTSRIPGFDVGGALLAVGLVALVLAFLRTRHH